MESEIWEQEDRDLRIKEIINDLAEDLKKIPKSGKDNYINKKLREILDEKKVLD